MKAAAILAIDFFFFWHLMQNEKEKFTMTTFATDFCF